VGEKEGRGDVLGWEGALAQEASAHTREASRIIPEYATEESVARVTTGAALGVPGSTVGRLMLGPDVSGRSMGPLPEAFQNE